MVSEKFICALKMVFEKFFQNTLGLERGLRAYPEMAPIPIESTGVSKKHADDYRT